MPAADTVFEATVNLVREHIARHPVSPDALPGFIANVHQTLLRIAAGDAPAPPAEAADPAEAAPARPVPAVPVSASVRHDRIICLEDGTEHTMMRRYLKRKFDLTPEEYRARWGLPDDYPMTAPGYSERKRGEAFRVGLGTAANKRGRQAERIAA